MYVLKIIADTLFCVNGITVLNDEVAGGSSSDLVSHMAGQGELAISPSQFYLELHQ